VALASLEAPMALASLEAPLVPAICMKTPMVMAFEAV